MRGDGRGAGELEASAGARAEGR